MHKVLGDSQEQVTPYVFFLYGPKNLLNYALKNTLEEKGGINCTIVPDPISQLSFKSPSDSIVLLDCNELNEDALNQILDQLPKNHLSPSVIMINSDACDNLHAYIRRPIIKGCFPSHLATHQILKGIHTIISGGSWFPRVVLEQFLEKNRRQAIPSTILSSSDLRKILTRRELEILHLVKTGASNTEIACELCLSHHTIKTHMHNLFRKLNVSNRIQAANWTSPS